MACSRSGAGLQEEPIRLAEQQRRAEIALAGHAFEPTQERRIYGLSLRVVQLTVVVFAAAQLEVTVGEEIAIPRANELDTFRRDAGAIPDRRIVFPMSVVKCTVRHPQYAGACALILAPFTGVFAAVGPNFASETLAHVRHPRSLIPERAADLHRAITSPLALAPGASYV
jgi:hypothetical protein